MNRDSTDDVPLAAKDLWLRKQDRPVLIAVRWVATCAIITALITSSKIAALLGTIAFFIQTLHNSARRRLYLQNLFGLPALREYGPEPRETPGVTVVVPGRNEVDAIVEAGRSVVALNYPNREIIFVNDHSTDETGALMDEIAAGNPNVRVLHNPAIEAGWQGKSNAIWSAVQSSDPQRPWLMFADADVVFHRDALRKAMAYAEVQGLDYLTCVLHIANGSLSEELYMPAPWSALIQGAHFARLNDSRTAPIGVGAFVLVKRDVYIASGGHAAIRGLQPEDTLLAALVKRYGGKVGVCWTSSMMHVRIYRGHRQLRDFIVRKIRFQNDSRIARLLNRANIILIQDVLPAPVALATATIQIAQGGFSLPLSALGVSATAAFLSNVRSFEKVRLVAHMRTGLEWLHPVGALLRLYFYAIAVLQIARGKGMEWRGRKFEQN
ncbi:MAG TPA: glycosyltransferase family 2 protein [Candidatus Hydrogenedentes bacterium]|nr:glycosyltransferase family 2 protein [Candidatus Hydrogenedentota bacterium]